MIIEQYGIRLRRITEDDIELIREWRNHPDIKNHMAYKRHITPKMQKKWFHSINNPFNYYFMIEYDNKKIGVINCKKLDLKRGYGEGGIFVFPNELKDEFVPVMASLCLLNTVFFVLKIFNKSFVQILRTNKRAINFNRGLGYVLAPGQDKMANPYYILTKEDYEKKTKRVNEIACKLTGDSQLPRIYGVESNFNLPEINQLLSEHKQD